MEPVSYYEKIRYPKLHNSFYIFYYVLLFRFFSLTIEHLTNRLKFNVHSKEKIKSAFLSLLKSCHVCLYCAKFENFTVLVPSIGGEGPNTAGTRQCQKRLGLSRYEFQYIAFCLCPPKIQVLIAYKIHSFHLNIPKFSGHSSINSKA